jgi:chemotaxis protein MotB
MKRIVPALLLCGCVSQGTFDKMQADYEESQTSLEARNQSLHSCEQATESGKTGEAEARAEADKQRENVRDLQQRIAQLLTERAGMLKNRSSLEASVTEMTAALVELEKRREAADARLQEFRDLLAKFSSLIHAGKLKVRIVDGRMVVVVGTDVLFGSGSATLSKEGRAAVAEVARILATLQKRKFQVEGHTDNVPISTAQFPSNWELSAVRALTVLKAMVEAGMPAARVSAAAFGDTAPSVSNDTAEGKTLNRRIEIILVPDLSLLPGFDELNQAQTKS